MRTPAEPGADETIVEVFERQVAESPDEPAVVGSGHAYTFGELNARANQLARHRRGQGIGPEDFVALALPRRRTTARSPRRHPVRPQSLIDAD